MKIAYTEVKHIKLRELAAEIKFKKDIQQCFETLWKSYSLLKEEETSEDLSSEEEAAIDQIMKTFVDAIKKEKSTVQTIASDETKIDKLEKEYPELAKLQEKVQEGNLNEFALTASLIAGIIAAIPSLIKIFGYAVKGIGSMLGRLGFDKASAKTKSFVNKIMSAGDDLHHKYIKVIQAGLKLMIKDFGSLPEDTQEKIADMVYTAIVVVLGYEAGVAAYESFKHANWLPGGVEAVLAAIKGGDLGAWIARTSAIVLSKV